MALHKKTPVKHFIPPCLKHTLRPKILPMMRIVHHAGMSLVELLVALTLLSMLSVAALQLMTTTETDLLTDHNTLNAQKRGTAITAYLNESFEAGAIYDGLPEQPYTNDEMSDELKSGSPLTVASLFGNESRFDLLNPKCVLLEDASIATKSFLFRIDCQKTGETTITTKINKLIAKGVKVAFSIEGAGSRCIISKPIPINAGSQVSSITVDDANCLKRGNNPAKAGSQILYPRFVAYDSAAPSTYHTSLIEPVSVPTPGISIEMPDNRSVIGGAIVNPYTDILARASIPGSTVSLELSTENKNSRLEIGGTIDGVTSHSQNAGSKLTLVGPIESVNLALAGLTYASQDDWFGEDRLIGRLRNGPLIRSDETKLYVKPNCGGQTAGTAILFDLGTFTPGVGFTRVQTITSVTVVASHTPRYQYGYCGYSDRRQRFTRYDRPDGTPTFILGSRLDDSICQRAAEANVQVMNQNKDLNNPGHYVQYSPRARGQATNAISVYLFEQMLNNTNNINAFSLFFNFDSFDTTGGTVRFTLNNIEQGRNLNNPSDPYVVLDDPSDFSPNQIGADGTLTANAFWRKPNDGVVVPLRLPNVPLEPGKTLYDLSSYAQDPDGDNISDPNLTLSDWTGLNRWVIWGTSVDGSSVGFREVNFDNATTSEKTAIQINISKSQRCS